MLGLNDTLTANFTKDISRHDDGHGSKQYAVNYTIPDGNRTYRLSTYKYSYNQLVFMPNAFRSAGTTQGTEVSVEQVLNRTSRSKTSVIAKVNHKSRHNYLDDVEIGVQEQHTTSVELGLSHRQYRGNTVSDMYVFYRQGIKGLGAKVRSWEGLADNPTTLYKMAGVEGQIQTGVRIGHKQGIFSMRFRSQFTNQRLFTTDQFSIGDGIQYVDLVGKKHYEVILGTMYKVNGHYHLEKQQITPYIGIDIGHVWGPSTETQLGNTLIGGVVGVRGNCW